MSPQECLLAAAEILDLEHSKRKGHGKSEVGPWAKRLADELRKFAAEVHLPEEKNAHSGATETE